MSTDAWASETGSKVGNAIGTNEVYISKAFSNKIP